MAVLLSLILAESALEPVPRELRNHPSVVAHAGRSGRRPEETLLDRSVHHSAMMGLKDSERRGRPDIVHLCLLEATATPLYKAGGLSVYVHTYDDHSIILGRDVRLPRSFNLFVGLICDLYSRGRILAGDRVLLEKRRQGLKELLDDIRPALTVGLSRVGESIRLRELAGRLSTAPTAAVLVGAFPRGHFRKSTVGILDSLHSVSRLGLESHLVVGRLLYEYERLKDGSEGAFYY